MKFTHKIFDKNLPLECKSELENYCRDNNFIKRVGFNELNFLDFTKECNLTSNWLTKNDINPYRMFLVVTPPGSNIKNTHTDSHVSVIDPIGKHHESTEVLGFNVGIINCIDTYTSFYEYVSGDYIDIFTKFGIPYRFYGNAVLKEIAKYNLENPVIINTTVPHAVHNPTNQLRMSLSFRFKVDPWYLVYD